MNLSQKGNITIKGISYKYSTKVLSLVNHEPNFTHTKFSSGEILLTINGIDYRIDYEITERRNVYNSKKVYAFDLNGRIVKPTSIKDLIKRAVVLLIE